MKIDPVKKEGEKGLRPSWADGGKIWGIPDPIPVGRSSQP